MPDLLSADALPPFDPNPLALTPGEGRLYLPEGYLGRFEGLEATSAMVSDFKGEWYDKFTTGNVCLATVKNALLGNCREIGGDDGTTARHPNPPSDADDPTNENDLKKLAMAGRVDDSE